jgi:hypothetical protein
MYRIDRNFSYSMNDGPSGISSPCGADNIVQLPSGTLADVDFEDQFVTEGKTRITSEDLQHAPLDGDCRRRLKVLRDASQFHLDVESCGKTRFQNCDVRDHVLSPRASASIAKLRTELRSPERGVLRIHRQSQ